MFVQTLHSTPVQAVGFNPSRKNLLASGGTEVAIHNLEHNVSDPEVFSPGDNLHEESPITAVSWNRKVPHILGSASQNGISVVWDLKINKAIFNFSDCNKQATNRNVSLSWNPEVPTQIAVAYDDPKAPEFQVWDLRNPKGPIFSAEKVHNDGIHSLDWCTADPSLIITLGRDNKVCVWNYKVGGSSNLISETLLDEPSSNVLWSPRQSDIYSITSTQGTSAIYSLNDQIDHIPTYLRPPVGARFSFDGRIATFGNKNNDVSIREYTIGDVEDRLLKYVKDFERNFTSLNLNPESLCDDRIASSLLTELEKEEWRFIKAVIHNNSDDVIQVTGLNKEEVIRQTEAYTNKVYAKKVETKKAVKSNNFSVPSQEEAEDFFRSFAEQNTKKEEDKDATNNISDEEEEVKINETISKNVNWNAGGEKMIKRNILIGNVEGAVDAALKCGRVAEAFILAYSKDEEYFYSTVQAYITSANDPFTKSVIKCIFEEQIEELVEKYPLENWKECVALCVNLSKGFNATFRKHMETLALRFSKIGDHNNALLCYILSQNFLRILETFAFRTEAFQKGSFDHSVFLMRTIEKLVALKLVTRNYESNPIVDRFIYELTKTLHAYNKDNVILNLITINNSQGFECLALQDRILGSYPQYAKLYPGQKLPFRLENVSVKTQKQVQNQNLRSGGQQGTISENRSVDPNHPAQQQQAGRGLQPRVLGRNQAQNPQTQASISNPQLNSSQGSPYIAQKSEPNHHPPIPAGVDGPKHSITAFNPAAQRSNVPPSFGTHKPQMVGPSNPGTGFRSGPQTSSQIGQENPSFQDASSNIYNNPNSMINAPFSPESSSSTSSTSYLTARN